MQSNIFDLCCKHVKQRNTETGEEFTIFVSAVYLSSSRDQLQLVGRDENGTTRLMEVWVQDIDTLFNEGIVEHCHINSNGMSVYTEVSLEPMTEKSKESESICDSPITYALDCFLGTLKASSRARIDKAAKDGEDRELYKYYIKTNVGYRYFSEQEVEVIGKYLGYRGIDSIKDIYKALNE